MQSRRGRATQSAEGLLDLESLVGILRDLWQTAGSTDPTLRVKLCQTIAESVQKLKKLVEDQLSDQAAKPAAYPLFKGMGEADGQGTVTERSNRGSRRFHEPILRLYDKDLADQALALLPQAIRFSSVEEFREHLARTISFNAESTRRRAATYLTGRYFPCGIINEDLARFASVSEGHSWLGDVLFYLTCRIEKIVAMVAEEVVWPSLADGGVSRTRITEYVQRQVPSWSKNSVTDVGAAIVRTYERFGIGSTTRTHLNVSIRQGDLPAFAYILHLECPEPGMYGFEMLLQSPMRRWLLWDQQWIVKQLYACEGAGLLAKISEIDRAKQFTTRYTLDEAVGPIVSLIRGGVHEAVRP
jgi:hypothetical protein